MIPYADLEQALARYKARLAGYAAAPVVQEAPEGPEAITAVEVAMATPEPVEVSEPSGVVVVAEDVGAEEVYSGEGGEPVAVPTEGTGEIDPNQIVD